MRSDLPRVRHDWYEDNSNDWSENTQLDDKWQLSNHLLPFFRRHHLPQITVAEVDRYRNAKLREGKLSGESINKTLTRLGQVLDTAMEYEYITRNPVRVNWKKRKAKASKPAPVWLDRAEHITALLDAAGELDREARCTN